MFRLSSRLIFCGLMIIAASAAHADDAYTQHKNIVYAEVHGVALVLDVFVPKDDVKNGHAIVDIASGAWFSNRDKIRDHKRAQVFRMMCRKGFTVFAVRPGSISRFSGLDMLDHVNKGIVWVKQHADKYGIEADALGLMGASAGGHLACLTAVTANDKTRVKATAVFFPPTDFLDYGGIKADPKGGRRIGRLLRRLAFNDGIDGKSDEEVKAAIIAISPAHRVTEKAPPFLLIHGDADPAVPLQQSKVMLAALKKHNVQAELIIKPGGAHPWPTIHEEVAIMADWFAKNLIEK